MRLLFAVALAAAELFRADALNGKWSSENNSNGGNIILTLRPEPAVVFTLDRPERAYDERKDQKRW